MSKPYKVRETLKYTETVYYDESGEEVFRDRNHDDWLYDTDKPQPLSDSEMEDYFPDYSEDDDA
jgi:hypothetical protein